MNIPIDKENNNYIITMNLNTDILRIIDKLDDEAFIIDNNGSILYSNLVAKKLLPRGFTSPRFFDLFLNETNEQIENLLEEVVSYSKDVKKELTVKFSDGSSIEVETTISQYQFEDKGKVFLIIFSQRINKLTEAKPVKILLSNKEINEIVKNDVVIKIIEDIKSNFPFTLIGKNNVQNEINKLNSFFWIKDSANKFILVNQKFAQSLGLKPSQLEGRYEREFMPSFLIEFSKSISGFISNTSNIVIKEGLPFPYNSNIQSYQVIEFPICDLDGKAVAIIGLTQYIGENQTVNESKYSCMIESLFENFPKPMLVLDKEEKIRIVNTKFSALFPSLQLDKKIGEHYEIISGKLKDLIRAFIDGSYNEKKFDVELEADKSNQLFFVFNLRKLYNSDGELEGYLLFAEESLSDLIKTLNNDRAKMYEIMIQNSAEPMFIYDAENLRFLDVNLAALDMYGYSKDEFLQMDFTDLYSPEDIQTLLDTSEKQTLEQKFTGPWRQKKKNGSAIFVEINKSTFDNKGKKAYFNIVRDVTEKLDLERKIQLYKASFDHTADLLFVTDAEGFITFANEQVKKVLGYSNSELENRPFITLASDEDRIKLNSEVFGEDLRQPIKLEAILKTKENELIETNLIASPVIDFNKQIISFNITVQTAATEAGISVREGTGVKETESKEKGIMVSESFLSSTFHEILTPMNVILGFVQELSENIASPTSEQKEALEIIEQNRDVLLQTMDSLLEYSHIEQNKIELKPEKFLFTDIIDNLQKNTQKSAKSSKVEFTYGKISSSLSIVTDKLRMESLLMIFISSAMRITKEKKIYISAYQYDDDNYVVSIKDNRKSISKFLSENINNIFSSDGNEIKKDFGISKLKLQLLKKLLELLGGKYEAVSRGSEVTEVGFVFPFELKVAEKEEAITEPEVVEEKEEPVATTEKEEIEIEEPVLPPEEKIPVETEREEEIKTAIEEEPVKEEIIQEVVSESKPILEEKRTSDKEEEKIDLSQITCLYLEDQVDSQILFKVQMKELRLIDFAVSFEAALPLLDQKKYDFIILDINLQGEYNGLDALRIIRKMPGYDKTKIIAVTAYVLPGDREKFIAAGFNDFISKPILREKLVDSFKRIISGDK